MRVHKADRSTLNTPPENVQDLDSEITRSAPFYSDLREKHVAVKALDFQAFIKHDPVVLKVVLEPELSRNQELSSVPVCLVFESVAFTQDASRACCQGKRTASHAYGHHGRRFPRLYVDLLQAEKRQGT